jgi:hypothetical protein
MATAKKCARCQICKPAQEFGLNSAKKDGLQVYCKSCMKQYRSEKAYDKLRWQERREHESKRNRQYRQLNADRLLPAYRERAAARRIANPGAIRANNIARKHGERRATPTWADIQAINAVYAAAKEMEAADGIKRHVDHTVPLKHPLVCGLHVQSNLQILTAADNMKKHNSFAVDA